MADAYQMFINGEWVNSSDGQTRDVINPATGEVLATVQEGTKEDADRAVAAARRAFEGDWFDSTPKDRQLALLKFADAIEENADEIVKLEAQNVGKPAAVTLSEEIPPIVDNLRFFAGAARTMEGRAAGEYMAGFTSYVRREPIGVAGLIAPWNYPLMMAIWKIGPALATGNTIVLKPSEMTPLTALKLAELTADILPPGVFNVVTGDGVPVGDTIVRHPDVGIVSLTGDTATGKLIAANSAETLKRVHLELGGKAPFIVFDDADMEQVIEFIKIGGYFNSGQDCTASARILVGSGAYENVLAELVPAVESIKVGDPFSDDTEMGSMVSKEQLERVTGFVQRAEEAGGKVLTGGKAIDQQGLLVQPHGRERGRPGLRDHPEGGLRSGRHGATVRRRGAGPRVGERRALRIVELRVDPGRGPGAPDGAQAPVRLRVDQHPHPAHAGDAARRVQAVRPRQGHVGVLARGLHEHQARDGVARLRRTPRKTKAVRTWP